MSARSFDQTWERAKIKRKRQGSKYRASQLPKLDPCPLDPNRSNLHPALLLERDLLTLEDQAFQDLAPAHAQKLHDNQPAKTGIDWIDELERRLYKEG